MSKNNSTYENHFRWAGVRGPSRKNVTPSEEFLTRDEGAEADEDVIVEPAKPIPVHARYNLSDQVCFVAVQLVIRSMLKFCSCQIFLNTPQYSCTPTK